MTSRLFFILSPLGMKSAKKDRISFSKTIIAVSFEHNALVSPFSLQLITKQLMNKSIKAISLLMFSIDLALIISSKTFSKLNRTFYLCTFAKDQRNSQTTSLVLFSKSILKNIFSTKHLESLSNSSISYSLGNKFGIISLIKISFMFCLKKSKYFSLVQKLLKYFTELSRMTLFSLP